MADAAQVTVTVNSRGCCKNKKAKLKAIFIGLASLSIIINLDGGAVPAALIEIENTFGLSTAGVGVLGMLVYEGIGCGSLLVGPLLRCGSAVRFTQATLCLNTCATFAFGASQSQAMLFCFRLLIGLLQAIPAVYFPVCTPPPRSLHHARRSPTRAPAMLAARWLLRLCS